MKACLRMGLKWGEWEHLQPVEIWEAWEADMWRWNRVVALHAKATVLVAGSLGEKLDVEEVATAMGWKDE